MFSFRPSVIPNNVFVVGCGGTGSRLIPVLIQFMRSITKEHNPAGWLGNSNIILIDGDIVEQKNLMRQNFVSNDVGKNKAAVLANRYGKAYGMNVVPYTKFIEKDEAPVTFRTHLNEVTGLDLRRSTGNDLVIMCVDSAEARRLVLTALAPLSDGYRTTFIDAGNEDSFGQVRMFHNAVWTEYEEITEEMLRKEYRNPERLEYVSELDYIPFDFNFYANMVDNPGLGSCADLDQTLAINSLMATFIMSFVQNLYYNKVIDYNEVSVDIVKGSTAYTKNTVANYRNKILIGEQTAGVGYGASVENGLKGNCTSVEGKYLLRGFLNQNSAAISRLAMEQSEPTPVLESTDKKAKRKKEVIKVEPLEVEIEMHPVPLNQIGTVSENGINVPMVEIVDLGPAGVSRGPVLEQAEARTRAATIPAIVEAQEPW